jgi:heme exporter protein A
LKQLRGHDLAIVRGHNVLFRGLSFDVSAGEVLSVEGANGAGKTSLLRAIAGFLEPRAGKLALHTQSGAEISDPDERARFTGWLGHQDGIKPQSTPVETLKFFARYHGGGDIERALYRLELSRLRELPVQYLSAGQKKRLAFARLTLIDRPLWLLDEPLSSLDSGGRSLAGELIAQHCGEGGIVIAATHEALGVPCRSLALGTP